jgi:N-acetylglucosaminyldiphosphoundecaprenol N-acetyl-beta-D-mannosaminyltransferase
MSLQAAQRVNVAGVPVTVLSADELVDRLAAFAAGAGQATVGYLNAHVSNLAARDAALHAALAGATLVWPDGVSGYLACALGGVRPAHRLGGFYFLDALCRRFARAGRRQFLLGGESPVVQRAADVLAQRYGRDMIAGSHDGYFGADQDAGVIERINASGADVLTVGMGTPRQECWVARHAGQLRPRLIWTVGALFDFVTGRERPAPAWLGKAGLEWVWRLMLDPAGKARRYLAGNPRFLYRMIRRRPRVLP